MLICSDEDTRPTGFPESVPRRRTDPGSRPPAPTRTGRTAIAAIVMGAVIANAIFDAVGARILQLPLTAERIKNALNKE